MSTPTSHTVRRSPPARPFHTICTDVFAYGDSRLAWAPRLRTGDSQGKFVSASDSADVTAHNVTGRLSFYHNPSETFERYGYTEHIELKFRQAVYPAALDIGENRGMCAFFLKPPLRPPPCVPSLICRGANPSHHF